MKYIHCLTIALLFFISCNNKSKVAAVVGSEEILLSEVDEKVNQELFDQLNRIYTIRTIALNDIIKEKILNIEAKKYNTNTNDFLEALYKDRINEDKISFFIVKNKFENGIPELKSSLILHDINSEKGRELIMKSLKQEVLNEYIDSVKNTLNIQKKILPPSSQFIKLNNNITHYRGNLNSKIIVLEISDYECDMCKTQNPIMKKIYEKYKNKVKFAFTHYGSYVSPSAIGSECAAKQGKFWEFSDSVFELDQAADSSKIFDLAKSLNIDMSIFKNDYSNPNISFDIEKNMLDINSSGIYGTPTIIINNRLVYNSSSRDEIETMIENELDKL